MKDGVLMKEDKSLRILIVDDHQVFRQQVCTLLGSHLGFEVIGEAADGQEAVSRAEELQPDVVVLDISMPIRGGIEAAGRIRRVAPKSQIVFLSQHDSDQIAQTALATGALAYVTKSSVSKDLIPAVKAVSEGKKFVSKLRRRGLHDG
jgi:DNA-binding NarL/FixJ family response regulator